MMQYASRVVLKLFWNIKRILLLSHMWSSFFKAFISKENFFFINIIIIFPFSFQFEAIEKLWRYQT